MSFNGGAVVGADVDIDAQHLSLRLFGLNGFAFFDRVAHIKQRQHGRAENERPAVGDPRFDDEVGLDFPDQFLHGDHVLRVLDNRPPKPREIVGILWQKGLLHERRCGIDQRCVVCHVGDALTDLLVKFTHDRWKYSCIGCWTWL